jgi:aldehyde:ferredoxin oxidoreductase
VVKGHKFDKKKIQELLDEYYTLHGWDKEGVSTPDMLKKFELDREPSHML